MINSFGTYIKSLIRIIISCILAVCLLDLFAFVYDYQGVHENSDTGVTDTKYAAGQVRNNLKEGFAHIKMDDNGFNNIQMTDVSSVDILLMGSSHMEAVQIFQSENVGYLLNEYLHEEKTYNIGVAGHNIYTCVQNMANASNTYDSAEYIILETATVELEQHSMAESIGGGVS